MTEPTTTDGHLLDRRLHYTQPRHGYRTGIEPIFLAAAVPARPGQHVLEAGTGAGAATLCLAYRVPGVSITAVEIDPALADLARRNVAANTLTPAPTIITADILDDPALGPFDHACANPPWHDPAGTASPDPQRDTAKRAVPGLLARWTRSLADRLRPRGTLTLILPAASLPDGIAALSAAACGNISLIPLWPKCGQPARIILLQGVRHAVGPAAVHSGIVLHDHDGGYTDQADSVLRGGRQIEKK